MAIRNLASLPNSRIKPRNATRTASTKFIDVTANTITKLVEANPDRTYITIYNNDSQEILRYGYENDINALNFTLRPDRAIDIESLGEIYVFSTSDIRVEYDEGEG